MIDQALAQRIAVGLHDRIGQGFALLEAAIVIGTLAQRFRFRLVPGHPVVPEPLVTLRPRNGIPMALEARN